MNTDMKNKVYASAQKSQYDESAKQLLGQKIILAHILAKTVDEFKGMNPKDIVSFIEGEPLIGIVPVEPGLTNAQTTENSQKITGFNSENSEINEGLVRFDIVFYVRTKDGLSQIILNVEAQKDRPSGYDILNRAVFYVSRLISSQKGRDFENTNYNEIKRVYSIWIIMNMEENIMTHMYLAQKGMACRDMDGDGMKDIVVLARYSYSDQEGKLLIDTKCHIYYQRTDGFAEDTEFGTYYQCQETDTMEKLVGIIREYWGWPKEE